MTYPNLSSQIVGEYAHSLRERLNTKLASDSALHQEVGDTSVEHLIWMCEQIERHARRENGEGAIMHITKMNRWLGYVQGVMCDRGLTTVGEERSFYKSMKAELTRGQTVDVYLRRGLARLEIYHVGGKKSSLMDLVLLMLSQADFPVFSFVSSTEVILPYWPYAVDRELGLKFAQMGATLPVPTTDLLMAVGDDHDVLLGAF